MLSMRWDFALGLSEEDLTVAAAADAQRAEESSARFMLGRYLFLVRARCDAMPAA